MLPNYVSQLYSLIAFKWHCHKISQSFKIFLERRRRQREEDSQARRRNWQERFEASRSTNAQDSSAEVPSRRRSKLIAAFNMQQLWPLSVIVFCMQLSVRYLLRVLRLLF